MNHKGILEIVGQLSDSEGYNDVSIAIGRLVHKKQNQRVQLRRLNRAILEQKAIIDSLRSRNIKLVNQLSQEREDDHETIEGEDSVIGGSSSFGQPFDRVGGHATS